MLCRRERWLGLNLAIAMPEIRGLFLDSAGAPIDCKLAVRLDDVLVFTASTPHQIRIPETHVFEVVDGVIDLQLEESATQQTTYNFHFYREVNSPLYFRLNGDAFTGTIHEEDGVTYTGATPSLDREELFVQDFITEDTLYRRSAIVPINPTIEFADLVGQSVTAARFVDRAYYRAVSAGLPGSIP